MLRFVAQRLGVPMRALAVDGDDPVVEVLMARRGGATALAVTTGTTPREEWQLDTRHVGRRVLVFDRLDSTSNHAALLADDLQRPSAALPPCQ